MPLDLQGMQEKIADLGASLEKDLPEYKSLLAVIHRELQQQPELVYKLDDVQIAMIVTGLGKLHQVDIIDVKDAKPISKKAGAKLSAEDV